MRDAHPDYQKNYWQNHPEAAARNRQQQRQRDQKRRVGLLVKNTLVVDLKRSAAEVWLVGPLARDLVKNTLVLDLKHSAAEVWLVGPLAGDLVKNTLVSSKLLILQAPSPAMAPAAAS